MEDMIQGVSSLKPIVISVIVKGSNYTLWSRIIKTSICGKGLWQHILEESSVDDEEDSEEGKKDEETKKEDAKWFQEDQLVLRFLQNNL